MASVLIVPGRGGSGEEHWQSHLERALPAATRVEQDDWEQPEIAVWARRLDQVARQCDEPPLVVAHSFGCLTLAYADIHFGTPVARSVLVAPADPGRFAIPDSAVMQPLSHPSEVLASTDDPWLSEDRVHRLALAWSSDLEVMGALGHVNVDSGFGYWPEMHRRIERLLAAA